MENQMESEQEISSPELPFDTLKEIISLQDLEERMKDLHSSLCNEDWNIRMKALQHLSFLLTEKNINRFNELPDLILQHLSSPIASQIEDRRSTLCKEACDTTSLLASQFGDRFQPIADIVWPVLMKLLIITIKIMATSGEQCITSFLPLLPPSYSLHFLSNESFDHHPSMRTGVANFVVTILRNASNKEELAKDDNTMETLSNLIRKAVSDSTPLARTHGRTAFEIFKEMDANRAEALFSSLGVPTQKQLQSKVPSSISSNGKPNLVQRKPLGKPNLKDFLKQQKTSTPKTESVQVEPIHELQETSSGVPPQVMELISNNEPKPLEEQKAEEMSSLEENTTSLSVSDPVTPRKRNVDERTENASKDVQSTIEAPQERPATPIVIHEKKPKTISAEETEAPIPPGKENLANPKEAEPNVSNAEPKKKISARVAKMIHYEKGNTPIAKRLRSVTRAKASLTATPIEPLNLEPLQIEGKKAPTSPRITKKKVSPRV